MAQALYGAPASPTLLHAAASHTPLSPGVIYPAPPLQVLAASHSHFYGCPRHHAAARHSAPRQRSEAFGGNRGESPDPTQPGSQSREAGPGSLALILAPTRPKLILLSKRARFPPRAPRRRVSLSHTRRLLRAADFLRLAENKNKNENPAQLPARAAPAELACRISVRKAPAHTAAAAGATRPPPPYGTSSE